jgi:hypothetical protein
MTTRKYKITEGTKTLVQTSVRYINKHIGKDMLLNPTRLYTKTHAGYTDT